MGLGAADGNDLTAHRDGPHSDGSCRATRGRNSGAVRLGVGTTVAQGNPVGSAWPTALTACGGYVVSKALPFPEPWQLPNCR